MMQRKKRELAVLSGLVPEGANGGTQSVSILSSLFRNVLQKAGHGYTRQDGYQIKHFQRPIDHALHVFRLASPGLVIVAVNAAKPTEGAFYTPTGRGTGEPHRRSRRG